MVSLFSETTPYVTIGDDYDKKAPVDPRNVGLKCFVTNPGKKGNMPNVLFEWSLGGFKSLHEGDPYIAPGQNNKGDSQEITRKFVGSGPFRYTNPMKKSTGLGGFDGCFQGYVPHETDFDVIKKGERPKRPEAGLRNIVTNPPKKGTFGVPGTLLSNSFGGVNADWKGLEYICDPFDTAQKAEQKQRALAASLLAEKAPFKVGSKSKQYFDESTNAGVSQIYKLKQPLQRRAPGPEKPPPPTKDAPWKPSFSSKSGLQGLFGTDGGTAFPPYREDPFEMKESKLKEERIKDKPVYGTWRPVSVHKSLPTKSIEFGRGF
ncbi:hypothetical protein DIPPA_09248 [Diplonema papillatum]|nr:hypothetical protein DIPPA_09248 [Diplonema papillatum]|eukprot:gene3434-5377_t